MAETVLRCAICGLPWAKIRDGVLIVESRHHGEIHVNVIAVNELERRVASPPEWLGQVEEKRVDGRQ